MASLEEVKAALEEAGKSELYEAVATAISGEEAKYIEKSRTLKGDIEKYSKYKKGFEALGFDGTTTIDGFVSGIKDKSNKSKAKEGTIEDLTLKFNNAESERKKFENMYMEEKSRVDTAEMRKDLEKHFGDRIYSAPHVIENLILKGNVKRLDGKTIFVDGDTTKQIQDGVTAFIESNPDIVRNNQKAGAGSGGSGQATNKKTMPLSQFNDLGPSERIAFVESGGEAV